MHVLIVFCHPKRSSFCGRLLDQASMGLTEAGHTVEVADLYAERFDPVFAAGDYVQFEGGTLPRTLLREQARVERANALFFVSPVWWLGMPAMLKGWFDRVWSNGWAYEWAHDPEGSLLPLKPFAFLMTAGGSQHSYEKYGYDAALNSIVRVGMLEWCGVSESTVAILHDTGFSAEADDRHLAYAKEFGLSVFTSELHGADASIVTLLRS